MGNVRGLPLSIGLIRRFRLNPSPWCLNYTNDGLPAGMHMDVLDHDLLLALAAMAIERVEQHANARELAGLVQIIPDEPGRLIGSQGHQMIRRAADILHVLAVEPFGQVRRDIAGAVVGEKLWPVDDLWPVEPDKVSRVEISRRTPSTKHLADITAFSAQRRRSTLRFRQRLPGRRALLPVPRNG